MIKKSFRLMLLAAFALSSVMFVACNKYDEDINDLYSKYDDLSAAVQSLKAAVDGGAVISSVSNTTEGVKFTLSNGQSYTVNHGTAGKDGQNGKDGQDGKDGKDGSVVTIGENGNWFIDGEDQGINATQPYVVNNGAWYSLYVMEQVDGANAEVVEVKLPTTGSITDIKVVGINSANAIVEAPAVQLNYGFKVTAAKGLSFNGKTYAKGTYLVAAGSSLTAMVNPLDADAALYNFSLVDSKGNANYVISDVKQHMSEKAITKAATPNKGLWTMNIAFAEGVDHSAAADRNKLAYALTTETMNGTVASAYDVVVEEKNITKVRFTAWGSLEADQDETLDLTDCFDVTGLGINYATHDDSKVSDLRPYIVDYYFEIADKTAAAAYGAVINGNEMTVAKAGNVDVIVHVLLVDGNDFSQKVTAKFNYVAPEGSLSKVEWTITDKTSKGENIVYLPLGDLQTSLIGSTDAQLPIVSVINDSWTWADGDKFDEKEVYVNGNYYGAAPAGKTATEFPSAWLNNVINTAQFYTVDNKGNFVKATKIQDALYIAFTFDYKTVFPGNYTVKLNISKAGKTAAEHASTPDFVVPVEVSVYNPSAPAMVKNEDYFSGNDAVVYGDPHTNKVWFDLTKLFTNYSNETHSWSFTETSVLTASTTDSATATYDKWLDGTVVKAPKFSYETTADALDMIYATREYVVNVLPFKNEYIPANEYKFNLTVKSPIAEGSIVLASDFEAAATGVGEDVIWVDMAKISATDANGLAYNLVNTLKLDNKVWVADKNADERVAIEIVLVDDNAKNNLAVYKDADNANFIYGSAVYPKFGFIRKNLGDAAQVNDITCKVGLKVTDDWGKVTTLEIPVTLKKAN